MRLFAAAIFAGIALSGCDQFSELEAFQACTEKMEVVFPAAKGLSQENFEDPQGIGNTDLDGNFNFVVPATDGSQYWSCRGNLKSRQIDELVFNGLAKQPREAEYWSY